MGMDQTVEVQTRIARALPQPNTDNQAIDVPLRGGRYGDVKTETLTYWRHLLADEGTYFTCNDAQTGLATAATPTAFSDTNPFLIIINRDNPGGRRVYIDLMRLVCTAIGTAGATVQFAVQLDSYPSRMIGATIGGTDLTANIVSPNFDMAVKSVVEIHAGNLAPNAKSSMNRVVE